VHRITAANGSSVVDKSIKSKVEDLRQLFDGNVLALDIASFLQTTLKAAEPICEHVRQSEPEKSNDRHRRLLRLCRKRPPGLETSPLARCGRLLHCKHFAHLMIPTQGDCWTGRTDWH
jgi:hypothetical protein